MNEQEKILCEIAQRESWLAILLPTEKAPSSEHLKLRVRVAIDEQWLSRHLGETSEPVPASLRYSVRLSLDRRENQLVRPAFHITGQWRKLLGVGLGLAAMLFLSVTIFQSNDGDKASDDLPELAAFEESTGEDEGEGENGDLVEIDNELAELDALVASLYESESEDVFEGL